MRRKAIVFSIAVITLALASVQAASARDIVVEVTSIAASSRPADERGEAVELDSRLAPISRNLRTLFAYDSYTFLDADREAVDLGKSVTFQLPEHFLIEIAPERVGLNGSEMVKMMVSLFREAPRKRGARSDEVREREVVLRTEIRLKNGGTVLLGGPPISGGVLVLALSAKG